MGSRFIFAFLVALGLLASCGGDPPSGDDASTPDAPDASEDAVPIRCGPGDDDDEDLISAMDEGDDDFDDDGDDNSEDADSDDDGIDDREEAGDVDCDTPPVDSDDDGSPDFLDTDANGDGVPDEDQLGDGNDDGQPDWQSDDSDDDGISNTDEWGEDDVPLDSDGDGTTDLWDDDSDGDTISDSHEGARDSDADGDPNYRDLDSDGDTIADALEAGDGDVETAPVACAHEIDPVSGEEMGDSFPDAADPDQDNDGLGDGEEEAVGTDKCGIDTDGDGFSDLVEGAYEQLNCPDGVSGQDCGCATLAGCGIPSDDYFVVLPYNGAAVERDLDFGTTIRVADIFFVTDTTGSMSGVLNNVKTTVTTPGTGLITRITETIPDAWFGGGQHDDFPFGGYGSFGDDSFKLAIRMTPPEMASSVQTAFNSMGIHSGGDGPESQTEALYQIIVGDGGTWTYGGSSYNLPAYRGECLDSGWGAPCFREAALPIIIHFSDICSHNGPPGEDTECMPYTSISPSPHLWTDAIDVMNTRGAKYVGINSSGQSCAGVTGPSGYLPCFFMKRTAEDTGSVDLDGNTLVYDLPSSGGSTTLFADTIVSAIETIATRVPLDVDTALVDDTSDTAGVDARGFIKRRQPACNAVPPSEPCWEAPEGTEHEDAVAFVDQSTFFGVIPGTRVEFRITFQNDFVPGGPASQLFIAFIQVRGGGSAVLDTRQVFVLVPAAGAIFG